MSNNSKKIRLIWSDDVDEMFPDEHEREQMYKEHLEINELTVDDLNMDDFLNDTVQMYLDDEKVNINFQERKNGEKYYLVLADLGLWNGRADGGLIIKGIWNAICKCFEDYNKIYFDGKRLKIQAVHHDGTNYFQIRELTDKGVEYWNNHPYMSDRELHQRLFNDSHYTHEVSIFKEVYGWK